jgi:uncharacterized protein YjbI with pentapeptide repeats
MRAISLFLCIALLTTSVDAVTYQKIDGSVVTLKDTSGDDHPYSGDNLEPYANILSGGNAPLPSPLSYADLRDADLRNVSGTWVSIGGADLTGANLSNASLPWIYGQSITLVNTNFSGADLSNGWMEASDFTNANFTNTNLSNVEFGIWCTTSGADFTNANLSGARLSPTMSNAQMLSAASLHGAKFGENGSHWSNKDFSNLDITEGVFVGTNLYGANFSGAILRDADLKSAPYGPSWADATNSNFSGADLDGAQIEYRDFTGANFQNAQLTNITETSGAKFVNVDFRNADLSNSVFAYMDGPFQHSTDSWGADLSGANLTNATIALSPVHGWALNDFSGANISGVTFLEFDYPTSDVGNTWTGAFYYTDNEPTWGTGMDTAWRSSVGILAIAPVPEPAAILLALLGLALLPRRRRR